MNKKRNKIVITLLVVIVCLFAVAPFVWMISTSFKPPQEIYSEPSLIPHNPTLDGYKDMMFKSSRNFNMKNWAINSIIVSTSTTIFSLLIASLGGYGISRFRFRGKAFLSYVILMTQVLPGSLLIIPLYVLLNNLNLLNSLTALVLAYTTFSVPFCTWMMKGFFDTIPKSLDEAASVDGCGKIRTFFTVILPLATPGLVATGLFSFISGWNEYLFACRCITDMAAPL
jgi:ABC-type glycerol-3-phosphate transport system permease component